jgi:hypothetical protein
MTMPPRTRQNGTNPDNVATPPQDMSAALKKLSLGAGGRFNAQDDPWQLDYVGKEEDSDDDSAGTTVTVNDAFHLVTPSSTTTCSL